ncbi:MAG: MGH1-like glycoside hydrolase domain-containing protein, partial [Eubacteriales bacterium]
GVAENDDVAPDFPAKLLECGKGNVKNFLNFQLEDGYIPMMVNEPNADEPYLLRKHNEGEILNMHKPFLCQQICLVSGYAGDFEWIRGDLDKLKKYLACYDRYYYNENCGLYVWADDVMIGVDNDPATFGRPRFSTASVFLNSFLVRELQSMAKICTAFGCAQDAAYYNDKAEKLIEAIQAECYDARDKMFYSVDVDIKTRPYDWFHKGLGVFWKTLFIKVRCWSNFLPMLIGFATPEQAAALKDHMMDEATFLSPGGIRSLSRDEKMYNLEPTGNPSNWLGPIWIIAQYACFRALMNYGYRAEAEILCNRTLSLLGSDLRQSGDLHEYYNPETCEPIMNPGFVNWNVLALNMADELAGKPSPARFLP